jgi:hypothetical protein
VADGVEHVRQFRPDGFAIETNVFQQLFVPDFQRVGREQQVDLPIYTINNQVNKEVRIRRIGPYLAQRQLRFKARSPGTLLLVQQLTASITEERGARNCPGTAATGLALRGIFVGRQTRGSKRLAARIMK